MVRIPAVEDPPRIRHWPFLPRKRQPRLRGPIPKNWRRTVELALRY
jgi:hypothetical protein